LHFLQNKSFSSTIAPQYGQVLTVGKFFFLRGINAGTAILSTAIAKTKQIMPAKK
jgi:hypothetical protein